MGKLFRLFLFTAVIICLFFSCAKRMLVDSNFDVLSLSELESEPGGTAGDTGWVKVIFGEDTISYTIVRGADGNIWLQQNLGSDRVSLTIADTSSFGGLFQWGRWADGHESRSPQRLLNALPYADPSQIPYGMDLPFYYQAAPNMWWSTGAASDLWTANKHTEITSTNGCDPCRILGAGWRLPYDNEWQRIITEEQIVDVPTAFGSNLKLPAAGHRNGNNAQLFRVGERGYYWSSTTAPEAGKALVTHFWPDSVLRSNSAGRGNGYSVRCIKGAENPISTVPGTIIAHVPAYRNFFIGSPSIVVLPNGDYIASHDFFGPSAEARPGGQSLTRIYKSTDNGASWQQLADLSGQSNSVLFVHQNCLYILGFSKGAGNLVVRKSVDNGSTWTSPTSSTNGLLRTGRYMGAPTPVTVHNGRIWKAVEDADGAIQLFARQYRAYMMSAPVNADLLDSASWVLSNSLAYDASYAPTNQYAGWLEGNAVVAPNGQMLNILRIYAFNRNVERSARIQVSADGTTATFNPSTGFNFLLGGAKKFTIRYDSLSSKYWTVSNYVPPEFTGIKYLSEVRNTLALCSSSDLINWQMDSIIIEHPDIYFHGYQYADWQFEGNDIIMVSRTAHDDGVGGAKNFHDANFMTFHRIQNFRSY